MLEGDVLGLCERKQKLFILSRQCEKVDSPAGLGPAAAAASAAVRSNPQIMAVLTASGSPGSPAAGAVAAPAPCEREAAPSPQAKKQYGALADIFAKHRGEASSEG